MPDLTSSTRPEVRSERNDTPLDPLSVYRLDTSTNSLNCLLAFNKNKIIILTLITIIIVAEIVLVAV